MTQGYSVLSLTQIKNVFPLKNSPKYSTKFTDGPKSGKGVGCFVIIGSTIHHSLPSIFFIYSAKIYAIKLTSDLIMSEIKYYDKSLICSDSLSAFTNIHKNSSNNNYTVSQMYSLDATSKHKTIKFMWEPGRQCYCRHCC